MPYPKQRSVGDRVALGEISWLGNLSRVPEHDQDRSEIKLEYLRNTYGHRYVFTDQPYDKKKGQTFYAPPDVQIGVYVSALAFNKRASVTVTL